MKYKPLDWASRTHGGVSRIRLAAIAGVFIAAAVSLGLQPWDWPDVSFVDAVFLVPWLFWWVLPFVPVALALADGYSWIGSSAALGVAIAGTIQVPRWVEDSIRNDPSSTAVLIHLYDPLLVLLPVGAVLTADFLVRRLWTRPRPRGP